MENIFISYSRKDTEFAKKVVECLKAEDMEVWIDWEDIPPSADWVKEIQKGIEEADMFLLLASPDSLASMPVAEEIKHAVLNGKRILPCIAREIDVKSAPTTISHLNWLFFNRPQDVFESTIGKLLLAIRTDLDWAQAHKRLQVQALDWQRNQQEESYLLRGKNLLDAEAQLAVNGEKNPRLTDLQSEYVLKSREIENREIEEKRAKDQQIQLEQATSLRLRRVTYLISGVFTFIFIMLFIWLNQITSDLAIRSIKDQMLALIETSSGYISGDKFESFLKQFPEPTASAYNDPYYLDLLRFVNTIKDSNKNIQAQLAIYVIAKEKSTNTYSVVASTVKETPFRLLITSDNPADIHIVGMSKTIADPTTIYKNENGGWICSCSPILNSSGTSIGALCADFNDSLLEDTRRRVTTALAVVFLVVYPLMIVVIWFITQSVAPRVFGWMKKPSF